MAVLNIKTEGAGVVNLEYRANNYVQVAYEFFEADGTTPYAFTGLVKIVVYAGTAVFKTLTAGNGFTMQGNTLTWGFNYDNSSRTYEINEVFGITDALPNGKPETIIKGTLVGRFDNTSYAISEDPSTILIERKTVTNQVTITRLGAINGEAPGGPYVHNHDDRYFTEEEINQQFTQLQSNLNNNISAAAQVAKLEFAENYYNKQQINSLIATGARLFTADTLTQRNAISVLVGDRVFVKDDGDGKWAEYRADTAGVNADYTKINDEDNLNQVQTASQIKAAYESNADTNAFTDIQEARLDALTSTDGLAEGVNAARRYFSEERVRATPLTGVAASTDTAIVPQDTPLSAFGKVMASIAAIKLLITNLIPSLSGQSGRVLSNNGTALTWITPSSGTGTGITDGNKGDIIVTGSGANWQYNLGSIDYDDLNTTLKQKVDTAAAGGVPAATPSTAGVFKVADNNTLITSAEHAATMAQLTEQIAVSMASFLTNKGTIEVNTDITFQPSMNGQRIRNTAASVVTINAGTASSEFVMKKGAMSDFKLRFPTSYAIDPTWGYTTTTNGGFYELIVDKLLVVSVDATSLKINLEGAYSPTV